MKPIDAPPATRLEPATRGRETLIQLVSDLMRRSWSKVDASHYLDDYEASQWLTPTPLKQLQLAKLRRLVWHCFLNVPWYAQRMVGRGLVPSQIERLGGLELLPVMRAEDRTDDLPFRAQPLELVADERLTSGTRGTPRRVTIDADALERRTAVLHRVERWAGAPPGRIVAAWGREAVHAQRALDPAELGALKTALGRVRGAVVTGPGLALHELAGVLGDEATRARATGLRAALPRLLGYNAMSIAGVIVRGQDRQSGGATLAELFGARLSRWYATAEVGVIAATCDRVPSPTAMHLQADHLLLEALDEGGRAVPAGQDGRLHVTDLHNYAAPYLRYDLGDTGKLLPHSCPCGRSLPLVELTAS